MRAPVQAALQALLDASEATHEISIDAIGEALGTHAVSTDDIDAVLAELERRGRRIVAPEGARGEERLRAVVAAARALVSELGRRPSVAEIATRSGLSTDEVRHALALAKVMQR